MNLIIPARYQVFVREPLRWSHIKNQHFYNPSNKLTDLFSTIKRYKSKSPDSLVCELFKINGGLLGYYLVDLQDEEYYYCGQDAIDLKAKLLHLGIGRIDIS